GAAQPGRPGLSPDDGRPVDDGERARLARRRRAARLRDGGPLRRGVRLAAVLRPGRRLPARSDVPRRTRLPGHDAADSGAPAAGSAGAEVRRVLVSRRQDVLGGDYEKLAGTVEIELDPTHPANAAIVDLDRAPRNARGRVEGSADFMVLRPRRPPARGATALLEVSNRGGKALLPYFNRAAWSLDPSTAEDFGDRFLMRLNLTLIWVGWQFDVPRQPGLLRLRAPIARDGNGPIEGLVRSDWTVERPSPTLPLAHRD